MYSFLFTWTLNKTLFQTPPKFNWSIDEMASLLPVHIDPEEIQRQSFYLSQTRYMLLSSKSDKLSRTGKKKKKKLDKKF